MEVLDISAHEPERRLSKLIIPLVTNFGEIRKFMGMENCRQPWGRRLRVRLCKGTL